MILLPVHPMFHCNFKRSNPIFVTKCAPKSVFQNVIHSIPSIIEEWYSFPKATKEYLYLGNTQVLLINILSCIFKTNDPIVTPEKLT